MRIDDNLFIDERELLETFVTAQGPGGQNVNKVASAVELRFNLGKNQSLPSDVRERMFRVLASRLTAEGEIIVRAQRFRDQPRNRQDARDRLAALLAHAARPEVRRIATRPTSASKERRLAAKSHRGALKSGRATPDVDSSD